MSENIFEQMAAQLMQRWPEGEWAAYIGNPGLQGNLPGGAWVTVEAKWVTAGEWSPTPEKPTSAPACFEVQADASKGFDCHQVFHDEAEVVRAVAACERAIRAALEEVEQ